jgi:hypothetical protein
MPIPTPKDGQAEQEYVSECISAIIDEYGQEQASAICYSTYRKEKGLSKQEMMYSRLRQMHYRGINLMAEEDGLEGACWDGYEAIGTKVLDGRIVPNCVPIKE